MLKVIPCDRWTYIAEAFVYSSHNNLEILCIDFFSPLKSSGYLCDRVSVSHIALRVVKDLEGRRMGIKANSLVLT